MNFQSDSKMLMGVSKDEAAKIITERHLSELGITKEMVVSELQYWAWPEVFGSTVGPFGGVGGQSMTTFTMEAWEAFGSAVLFCQGKVIKSLDNWHPCSMRSYK